jgi:hypothetical protein
MDNTLASIHFWTVSFASNRSPTFHSTGLVVVEVVVVLFSFTSVTIGVVVEVVVDVLVVVSVGVVVVEEVVASTTSSICTVDIYDLVEERRGMKWGGIVDDKLIN